MKKRTVLPIILSVLTLAFLAFHPVRWRFVFFSKLASMDDKIVFRPIADMYRKGYGTERNLKLARYYYERAAWNGDLLAMRRLGHLFSHNVGVQKESEKVPGYWDDIELNYDKAHEWYIMAAEKGDKTSQCRLGYFNLMGIGRPRSFYYAFHWYLKAAEQGVLPAMRWVAFLYAHGMDSEPYRHEELYNWGDRDQWVGVPFDFEKVLYWSERVALRGWAPAMSRMGYFYSHGLGVPGKEMHCKGNPEVVFVDDDAGVRQAISNSEANIHPHKSNFLEACLLEGAGGDCPRDKERDKSFVFLSRDYKLAFEWYTKAAELGYAPAQRRLAYMYYVGKGVAQDYKKAFDWCLKSAKQGNQIAQCQVGCLYESGLGVVPDYHKALEWYTKSAEQGNKLADFYAARIAYEKKIGPEYEDVPQLSEDVASKQKGAQNSVYVTIIS